jgi:hypothetical protein
MALQSSGAISFNNINVELGVAGTTSASLNQSSYRTLAGVASGAISMSNFYGKSNAPAGGSDTRGISYNYSQDREGNNGQTAGAIGSAFGGSTIYINGAELYWLGLNYYYDVSYWIYSLTLYGIHAQNKFTSISGNGNTLTTASATSFATNSMVSNSTTWTWGPSYIAMVNFPLNRTGSALTATFTWI